MNSLKSYLIALLIVCLSSVCVFALEPNPTPIKVDLKPSSYTDNKLEMRLHMSIPDGWKVYAPDPGDTGLPLDLQLSGTTNMKDFVVQWPKSELMIDKFGNEELKTNVFTHEMVAVVTLTPQNPKEKVLVKAKLSFGACEKICIAATENFQFEVQPNFLGHNSTDQNLSHKKQCSPNKMSNLYPDYPFYIILLFALAGGIILNLMPCVLPVLALKLLNIVKYAGLSKKDITINLLATSSGIIFMFLILAGITIVLKTLGVNFGWGFQFQEPWFLIFIAIILLAFASNLWGDYEISLPQWLANSSTPKKQSEHSIHNSFAAGAFATVLATPCTAPFLSVSIAFALSQSEFMILLIYCTVGIGMALPYLLLAATPKALSILPKPGKWMITLKKFFAVLLIITLVWILYVLYYQISTFSLLILVGSLVIFKFVLSRTFKNKIISIVLIILATTGVLFLPQFMERNVVKSEMYHSSLWEDFSQTKLDEYVSNGKFVLVDITAEWCLICKSNKFFVLERADILDFFKKNNIILMRGDYTNHSEELLHFLQKHNRPGIPLNVMYGPKNKQGIVLPEILTKESVIGAFKDCCS